MDFVMRLLILLFLGCTAVAQTTTHLPPPPKYTDGVFLNPNTAKTQIFSIGANFNVTWNTTFTSTNLFLIFGGQYAKPFWCASATTQTWYEWIVDDHGNNTLPFSFRAVDADGTVAEQNGGGFYTGQFWIDDRELASTTVAAASPQTQTTIAGAASAVTSAATTTSISSTSTPATAAGAAATMSAAPSKTSSSNSTLAIGVGVGVGVGVVVVLAGLAAWWILHRRNKRNKAAAAAATAPMQQQHPQDGGQWHYNNQWGAPPPGASSYTGSPPPVKSPQPSELAPSYALPPQQQYHEAPGFPNDPRELPADTSGAQFEAGPKPGPGYR